MAHTSPPAGAECLKWHSFVQDATNQLHEVNDMTKSKGVLQDYLIASEKASPVYAQYHSQVRILEAVLKEDPYVKESQEAEYQLRARISELFNGDQVDSMHVFGKGNNRVIEVEITSLRSHSTTKRKRYRVYPEALESDRTAHQYLMTNAMKKFEEEQLKNALISLEGSLHMAKNIDCGPMRSSSSVNRLISDIESHIKDTTQKLKSLQNQPQVKQLIEEMDD
jgi:hypothetical protein